MPTSYRLRRAGQPAGAIARRLSPSAGAGYRPGSGPARRPACRAPTPVRRTPTTSCSTRSTTGVFRPGDRLVESELAERFGVSRTPIREALQRLEAQSVLARDGRSLVVSSLDHDQLGELYVVRAELEGLAARLAAQHAAPEEVRVLWDLVRRDRDARRPARPAGAGQPDLPPPDPPREPQPLPAPAARHGAPPDGAARHHLARRRGPRRPRRSTSTKRSSARSRRATAPPPRRRSATTSASPSRPA